MAGPEHHRRLRAPVRVLIVNDSVDEAEQLCQLFEAAGADAQMSLGAVGAAQSLLRFDPDIVVITDLRAGGDDGCAVAQWFGRLARGTSRSLYVCVSNRAVSERRQQHLAAGFDLCLVQPLTRTMVDAVVRLVVDGRFERRPRARPAVPGESPLLGLPLDAGP
jgi:two-component system, OmpR family, response regulator